MNFTKAIAVFVAGVLAFAVANRFVAVPPGGQFCVDVLFVRHDFRARGDRARQDRLDRLLLDIGQHFDDHVAAALDHPEDRRFLFLQRASSACSF